MFFLFVQILLWNYRTYIFFQINVYRVGEHRPNYKRTYNKQLLVINQIFILKIKIFLLPATSFREKKNGFKNVHV